MSAKKNIAVLAALLLLVVGSGWFLLRDRDRAPAEEIAGPRGAAAPAAEPAPLEPAELADSRPAPPAQADRTAITTESLAAESEETSEPKIEWELEDSQWVEGRVELPADTPAGERVVVMALDEELTPRRLYGDRGPADDAWRGETGRRGLLYATEAAADGRFRLAFPPDADRGWIAVTGRYVFSTQPQRIDLPATGEPLRLLPELGAWISGRLHAPQGAAEELQDFTDTELRLEIDITAAGITPMSMEGKLLDREIDAEPTGSFQFRGVRTQHPLQLAATPPHLAAHHQRGIEVEPGQHLELDITLTYGGRITGRVVDEKDAPIAEAEVAVRRPGIEGRILGPLRETESDESGRFDLAAVTPGRVIVEAEHEGYLQARLELPSILIEGAAIEDQRLELGSGQTIAGTVSFPDGSPAAEANVHVANDWTAGGGFGMGLGSSGGRDSTDEEGHFSVSGLAKGTYVVTADVEVDEGRFAGPWRAHEGGVKTGSEELTLRLREPIRLHGRVVDLAGAPVEKFAVQAKLKGSGGMFGIGAETESEDFDSGDGTFALGDLREGRWAVTVSAEGYGTSEPIEVELPAAPGAETSFVLEPAALVAGTVIDTGGRPVRGASVALQLDMGAMLAAQFAGGPRKVLSDEEGRFLLDDLDPGVLSVVAQLEGFASSEPATLELAPGEAADDVVLQLRLGGTIVGTVFGPDGHPVAGQMVSMQKTPSYQQQVLLTTEHDGTFRRDHLDPGKWQLVTMPDMLEASIAGANDPEGQDMSQIFQDMSMEMVDVAEGAVTEVVLGAPPENPVRLVGHVLHAGEPVSKAMVSLMPDGATGGLSAMKIQRTDEDGRFEVDLDVSGTYLVTVQTGISSGTQNSVELQETIPEGAADHEMTVNLPGGRIAGRVTGPDKKPLSNARVSLTVDGGVRYGTFLGGHYTETHTDQDGRYEISYLRPGTYSVAAGGIAMGGLFGGDSQGGRTIHAGITIGEDESKDGIDFRLARPGDLAGIVKDGSGAPVAGAAIFLRDEDGHLLERFSLIATDSGGRFTYKGLAPGHYLVTARTAAMASSGARAVEVAEGETAKAEIVLEAGTKLEVSVDDRTGADITDHVTISVVDAKGREVTGMMSMADMLDRIGGYTQGEQCVGPLPAGHYKVTATTDDGRSASKPVTLSGQDERTVKIRLK